MTSKMSELKHAIGELLDVYDAARDAAQRANDPAAVAAARETAVRTIASTAFQLAKGGAA